MKKVKNKKILIAGIISVIAFVVWTVMVKFVDVKAVGPENSCVGFSTFNMFVHNLFSVHMSLYNITDWLSIIPFLMIFCFTFYGLFQLISRRSIKKVDFDILILGGFYVIVMAVYLFFEFCVINYRPVLINGVLEASYPSSTTVLVMCVNITSIMVLNKRIKNIVIKKSVDYTIVVFTAFMVVSRLVSGVHWFSDIVGGILISIGLVMIYYSIVGLKKDRNVDVIPS